MPETVSRRTVLRAGAAVGALALAGCSGESQQTVNEEEVVVEENANLSRIELDMRAAEGDGEGSEFDVLVYPEDDVVCYMNGDGSSTRGGCVTDPELARKYVEIYRREREEADDAGN